MFTYSKAPRSQRGGFTIIELLVAVGVTALLVSLMVAITINILNAWNRSSGVLATNATARLVLDQVSQDLSGAIMRRDGNVWLAATVQGNPGGAFPDGFANVGNRNWSSSLKPDAGGASQSLILGEGSSEELRFGKLGVWLRFFTVQPDSNSLDGSGVPQLQNTSAPRAVAYQIVRRNLGSNAAPQFSYQLFRSEVRPFHSTTGASQDRSTFGIGYDLYSLTANGYNHTATLNEKDASNIRNPNIAQLIANDVVDFGIRLFERDSNGVIREVFPVDRRVGSPTVPTSVPVSFAATSNTTRTLALANAPESAPVYGFPTEAEIILRVLTPEGVRLIQALESGVATFADSWWDIVNKHSQVYTRRVEIKPRAL
jgi:type II secretory pathway pseudopilin PulG